MANVYTSNGAHAFDLTKLAKHARTGIGKSFRAYIFPLHSTAFSLMAHRYTDVGRASMKAGKLFFAFTFQMPSNASHTQICTIQKYKNECNTIQRLLVSVGSKIAISKL